MKRIFLTSGLVLCMACPAMAGTSITSGTDNCIQSVLDTATDGYQSTFVAQWTANFGTITLNPTADGAAANSSAAPTPLFTVSGTDAVWTKKDNNNNLVDANKVVAGGDLLTTDPTGKTVTFTTLNMNIPTDTTPVTSSGGVEPAVREFLGFYNTSDQQMVDGTGALTQAGASAANTNGNGSSTWTAKYQSCATPTLTAPVRDGYTFAGWTTDQAGQTAYTACIADTVPTLYAQWTANPTTITFDCNKPAGAQATNTISSDPTSRTVDMDASTTLTETCSLTGWTFNGWKCTDNALSTTLASTGAIGSNTLIPTSQTVYMKSSSAVTCYADWTVNTIYTSWDANNATSGGTGGGDSCEYDGDISLPSTPSRTGYTFTGWQVVTTPVQHVAQP